MTCCSCVFSYCETSCKGNQSIIILWCCIQSLQWNTRYFSTVSYRLVSWQYCGECTVMCYVGQVQSRLWYLWSRVADLNAKVSWWCDKLHSVEFTFYLNFISSSGFRSGTIAHTTSASILLKVKWQKSTKSRDSHSSTRPQPIHKGKFYWISQCKI